MHSFCFVMFLLTAVHFGFGKTKQADRLFILPATNAVLSL